MFKKITRHFSFPRFSSFCAQFQLRTRNIIAGVKCKARNATRRNTAVNKVAGMCWQKQKAFDSLFIAFFCMQNGANN